MLAGESPSEVARTLDDTGCQAWYPRSV